MTDIYAEAIHAVQSHELITSADFRKMLLAILSAPIDFSDDDSAEDYVLKNPHGTGRVIQRGVCVAHFYGERVKV